MPIAPGAHFDFPPLVTARLELSPGTSDDAAALFPHVHGENGRQVTDTLIWDGPDTVEDLASFLKLQETSTFAKGGFHWLLRDRTGDLTGRPGEPLGAIGLEEGAKEDEGEIGYWLAPPHWGKGLIAEAIVAICHLGFKNGYRQVRADVYVHNTRGCRLVEGLGFRRDGLIENYVVKRGVPVDVYRYVVTENELTA